MRAAMHTADESAVARLERWEASGATWNVVILTERLVVVELCTCHGEPVDRIRSVDPALVQYVSARRAV